jgi:hypothetical protein
MSTRRRFLSATVVGCLPVCFVLVIGCASPKAGIEPAAETASPPPIVDPAPSPPIGPPPGYVQSENYWVREKIILTSAPEPPASAPQKSSVKQGKKRQKTGKQTAG